MKCYHVVYRENVFYTLLYTSFCTGSPGCSRPKWRKTTWMMAAVAKKSPFVMVIKLCLFVYSLLISKFDEKINNYFSTTTLRWGLNHMSAGRVRHSGSVMYRSSLGFLTIWEISHVKVTSYFRWSGEVLKLLNASKSPSNMY